MELCSSKIFSKENFSYISEMKLSYILGNPENISYISKKRKP